MKHSKRLLTVLAIMWLVLLPIATFIDASLYKAPEYREFVSYGIPNNVFYAFLLQNIHELIVFSLGMILAYVLYRKDIYRWFQ